MGLEGQTEMGYSEKTVPRTPLPKVRGLTDEVVVLAPNQHSPWKSRAFVFLCGFLPHLHSEQRNPPPQDVDRLPRCSHELPPHSSVFP